MTLQWPPCESRYRLWQSGFSGERDCHLVFLQPPSLLWLDRSEKAGVWIRVCRPLRCAASGHGNVARVSASRALMLLDRYRTGRIMNEYNIKMNLSSVNASSWKAESVVLSLGFSVIFLVGTVGNSLVLAVLFRNGQMNTKTTNLFILNLGIADLCFIVFCVPFQATIYTLDEWVFGPVVCKVVHFIIFLTMYASIFTLTAVSLDRYLAICYPLRSRKMRTPKNALTSICLVWTLALVFSGPYLSYYAQMDLDGTVVCIPVWESKPRIIMDACTFIFGYLVPVLVLGLTYGRTIRYLWTSADPVKDMSELRRAKRKVTKMIVIVAALFCLCWLPHHLVILCMWFGRFPLNYTTYFLRILSHLVAYTNSCLNPIVYALVSKHFRKGFRKVFSCSLRTKEVNKVHVIQAVNTVSHVETSN